MEWKIINHNQFINHSSYGIFKTFGLTFQNSSWGIQMHQQLSQTICHRLRIILHKIPFTDKRLRLDQEMISLSSICSKIDPHSEKPLILTLSLAGKGEWFQNKFQLNLDWINPKLKSFHNYRIRFFQLVVDVKKLNQWVGKPLQNLWGHQWVKGSRDEN
jgi:hypothetical protein